MFVVSVYAGNVVHVFRSSIKTISCAYFTPDFLTGVERKDNWSHFSHTLPLVPHTLYSALQRLSAEAHDLHLSHLNFTYSSRPDAPVLQDLSLTLRSRALTCIVGKSGAGKSTLVSVLAGLLQPSSGSVSVGSEVVVQGGAVDDAQVCFCVCLCALCCVVVCVEIALVMVKYLGSSAVSARTVSIINVTLWKYCHT